MAFSRHDGANKSVDVLREEDAVFQDGAINSDGRYSLGAYRDCPLFWLPIIPISQWFEKCLIGLTPMCLTVKKFLPTIS